LEVTEEIYLDYEEPYKLHSFEIIEDDEEAWNEDNLILILIVQMMIQILIVLIKDELLSIGDIRTLMKTVMTKKRISSKSSTK